jgi:hypothetical protein
MLVPVMSLNICDISLRGSTIGLSLVSSSNFWNFCFMHSFGLTTTNLTARRRRTLLSPYLLSQQTNPSIFVSPAEWLHQIAFPLSKLRKALHSASLPCSQERCKPTLVRDEMCILLAPLPKSHHLRIPASQDWFQGMQNPRRRLSTRSSRSMPATCRSHFLSSRQ